MIELAPLSPELIWMALPAILLAGLVHGTFGIGFPMVATPLLAMFTDVLTAVLITLLPTMAVNLNIIAREGRKGFQGVSRHLWIVPFVLIGTIGGSLLLTQMDARPFLLFLAMAILLYLNQDRLKKINIHWVHKHNMSGYALFGSSAGLMAGTVNAMLPILIMLFLELRVASTTMIILFNINFLTGKLTQTAFFLRHSPALAPFLASTLWLVPVALLALNAGGVIRKRINEKRYLNIFRMVLWIMSGILIGRFVMAYM